MRPAPLGAVGVLRYAIQVSRQNYTETFMSEAIYCFDTATVRFFIYPDGVQGSCCVAEIGEDPLRDIFGARGGGDSLVDAFLRNDELIKSRAIERHRHGLGGTVVLETADFELSEY